MKVETLSNRTPKQPWMTFPEWLFKDGHPNRDLFENMESAKEHYTLFFMAMNAQCQVEVFGRLLERLNEARASYNPYDYSESAVRYAQSVINHQVSLWLQQFSPIFRNVAPAFFDNLIITEATEGQPITIEGSPNARHMSRGTSAFDILLNHPGTEMQFNRYIMAKIFYAKKK